MSAAARAVIDFVGTPMFMAKSGYEQILGTALFRLRFTATGAAQIPDSLPAQGTAATTIANSATIPTAIGWARVTNAGAVTGIILAVGTVHGQIQVVTVDKDAVGTVTMAAAGTSKVGTGVGCVLPIGGGGIFIWDATDAIWSQVAQ
jgi:hypothetical protein